MNSSQVSSVGVNNSSQTLHFTANGTFKISIFSDLHYGESQDSVGPENDAHTGRVMDSILATEQPQLVVLNGDLVSGDQTQQSNSTSYVDRVIHPLLERNVSWASTYGNHDSARNLCPDDVFEREARHQNCLTMKMVSNPSAGITNYYLPIFPHNRSAEVPEALLWFFDTKGGHTCSGPNDGDSDVRSDWVHQSATDWFISSHSQVMREYGKTIPSLAFFHIPTHAMRAFQTTGVNRQTEPGINDDVPAKQQGSTAAYQGQDTPFMKALLQTDGLLATFSGHDHGNDWCFKWDQRLPNMNRTGNGLNMCYGRRTGYGGYGDWDRGGRQILLHEMASDNAVETWVRLENGTSRARVALNSTYGQDRYITESRGNEPSQSGISFIFSFVYLCVMGKFLW